MMNVARIAWHLARDGGKGDDADREVDVEDPAPRKLIDKDTTEERTDDARHAKDSSEKSLVTATFSGRDDVADDCGRADDQTTTTEPLHGAERDELDEAVTEAREH